MSSRGYILFTNPVYNQFSSTVPPNPPQTYPWMMKSLFSDNSRVLYKPHSLSSGNVGTVRNSRRVARLT